MARMLDDRRRDASLYVQHAVARLVGGEAEGAHRDDPNFGFENRPPHFGSTVERREPRPGPDVRASVDVLHAAKNQLRLALGNARASGIPWTAIAADLRLEDAAAKAEMPLGTAAWRVAAMGVFPDEPDADTHWTRTYGPSAHWRCWTCGGSIIERDPQYGIEQRGHQDGCAQLQREIDAEQRRYDAEEWD